MPRRNVFISYSYPDKEWVARFAEALQKTNLDILTGSWADYHDMAPGEPWSDKLESSLRASDIVVILFGEREATPWQFFEIGAAVALGKQVVGVAPSGLAMPSDLKLRHLITRRTPENAAHELAASLAGGELK